MRSGFFYWRLTALALVLAALSAQAGPRRRYPAPRDITCDVVAIRKSIVGRCGSPHAVIDSFICPRCASRGAGVSSCAPPAQRARPRPAQARSIASRKSGSHDFYRLHAKPGKQSPANKALAASTYGKFRRDGTETKLTRGHVVLALPVLTLRDCKQRWKIGQIENWINQGNMGKRHGRVRSKRRATGRVHALSPITTYSRPRVRKG